MSSREFAVVVPVKQPARGKSRLGMLAAGLREDLVVSFALDTVGAALTTPSVRGVLAVTDDVRLASVLREAGCAVIPDGAAGLNDSLIQAAAETQRRWPGTRPVALLADLPCLDPDTLAEAVAALPDDEAGFVRDHHGFGTTLYSAPQGAFTPRFGAGSAAAHVADGAREVAVPARRLRLDVDDIDDIEAAVALGVGPHTGATLARNDWRADHP